VAGASYFRPPHPVARSPGSQFGRRALRAVLISSGLTSSYTDRRVPQFVPDQASRMAGGSVRNSGSRTPARFSAWKPIPLCRSRRPSCSSAGTEASHRSFARCSQVWTVVLGVSLLGSFPEGNTGVSPRPREGASRRAAKAFGVRRITLCLPAFSNSPPQCHFLLLQVHVGPEAAAEGTVSPPCLSFEDQCQPQLPIGLSALACPPYV